LKASVSSAVIITVREQEITRGAKSLRRILGELSRRDGQKKLTLKMANALLSQRNPATTEKRVRTYAVIPNEAQRSEESAFLHSREYTPIGYGFVATSCAVLSPVAQVAARGLCGRDLRPFAQFRRRGRSTVGPCHSEAAAARRLRVAPSPTAAEESLRPRRCPWPKPAPPMLSSRAPQREGSAVSLQLISLPLSVTGTTPN